MEGTVVWFNSKKGYGFLRSSDGKEVFCHHAAIDMPGYRQLTKDQRVKFEIEQGPQGTQAAHVEVVG